MRPRRPFGLLVPFLVLALAPVAQAQELPSLTAAMQRFTSNARAAGSALVVLRPEGDLHRSVHGTFDTQAELPIGAASRWLAIATVLTLVDEERLDLDVPVGRYLAEFDRDDKRALTLRLCLACTGGLPARPPRDVRGWDMAKFAAAIADTGLRGNVASEFRHSEIGVQIAAIAAERATGKSWHTLFAERIAAPLGLVHTRFGALEPLASEPGTAALPWVASGAVSTLDEYVRFLRLLAAGGRWQGREVLRAASVQAMWRDQVPGRIEVREPGLEADDVRYGLGAWLLALGDGGRRVTDVGAPGLVPWIDLDLEVGGVLAIADGRARRDFAVVQDAVRAAVLSPEVAGQSTTVDLVHGGRERRYHLHVPPGVDGAEGLPLLLVLHGGGGNGEQVRRSTALADRGVRAGFVVAFPGGTGRLRNRLLTWNSGGIKVYAAEHDVDDTGFLRAVVADVQQRVAIDPRRVFAAGHSNGGMMCHRLAREAADVFAGIAVVAGAMNFTDADATSPVAVLLVHGTADDHVRHEGGAPREAVGRAGEREDASVQQAVDYYVARNGLLGRPDSRTDGKVRIDDYRRPRSGRAATLPVRVITLEGGGHAWPGSTEKPRLLADTPFPFDASGAILEFFGALQSVAAPGEPAPAPTVPR